ncbi:MAG: hypothetical protein Kow0081_2310 [Candidatus Dojkabacteria bacterium]
MVLSKLAKKKKKAFSLVEVTVSLAIIGIILLIFFNSIITAARVSIESISKSRVREEFTNVLALVSKDIRNADRLENCFSGGTECIMVQNNDLVRWELCEESVCRYENNNLSFRTSAKSRIETFTFERGYIPEASATNSTRTNVLVTIIGEYNSQQVDSGKIFRQLSVSTRNYEI